MKTAEQVKDAMGFLLSCAYPEMIASEHNRNKEVHTELCKLVDSLLPSPASAHLKTGGEAMNRLIGFIDEELERIQKRGQGYSDTYAAGMVYKLEHIKREATEIMANQQPTPIVEGVSKEEGTVEIKIDRTTLPKDGQYIDFQTENEEWHTGYFVEGDDLFWVNDSVWFPKWNVHKWKIN